jgi:hypothetical protein
VGPEFDWWSARCPFALVDAVSAGPPMATPTATPAPMVDWSVTSVYNVFVGPCAGCLKSWMYDMWARAPMLGVGPPVAVKLRGRATAGRLHAPCVVVRLFDHWLW